MSYPVGRATDPLRRTHSSGHSEVSSSDPNMRRSIVVLEPCGRPYLQWGILEQLWKGGVSPLSASAGTQCFCSYVQPQIY